MKTVKLSYSILNAWSQGRYEDAVNMYRGGSIPITPEIELGRLKDELWSRHAATTHEMHPELGGAKLIGTVVVQQKFQKFFPFTDDMQILLRGKPDMVNGKVIRDFKCGKTPATQYVDGFQMDYYKLLVPEAEIGIYDCYNPYTKELANGIKFLGKHSAERALEHMFTYAGELIDYLIMQKQLIDYKPKEVAA